MGIDINLQKVEIENLEINQYNGYAVLLKNGANVQVIKVTKDDKISYFRPVSSVYNDKILLFDEEQGAKEYVIYNDTITDINGAFLNIKKYIEFTDYPSSDVILDQENMLRFINYVFKQYHSSYEFCDTTGCNSDAKDKINVFCNKANNETETNDPYDVYTSTSVYNSTPFILIHEIIHNLLFRNGINYDHHNNYSVSGVMYDNSEIKSTEVCKTKTMFIDFSTLLKIHGFINENLETYETLRKLFLPNNAKWDCKETFNKFLENNLGFTETESNIYRNLDKTYSNFNPDFLLKKIEHEYNSSNKEYVKVLNRRATLEWEFIKSIPEIETKIKEGEYIKRNTEYFIIERKENMRKILSYLKERYKLDKAFILEFNNVLKRVKINVIDLPKLRF